MANMTAAQAAKVFFSYAHADAQHRDRLEKGLSMLKHADLYSTEASGRAWGPLGRFAWKFHSADMTSPFHRLLAESERDGPAWPPIRAGMFQSSIERFRETATSYGLTIATLGWY